MRKNMVLCIAVVLGLVSAAAKAADGAETENVQELINRAGYECDRVDRVEKETIWLEGEATKVTCDKNFTFLVRYKHGGVSVEVVTL